MKHSREFVEMLEVLMADANVSLLGTLAFRREIVGLVVSDNAPITRALVDTESEGTDVQELRVRCTDSRRPNSIRGMSGTRKDLRRSAGF